MFLATDHSTQLNTDLPRHCTFRESDWHILAGFWHPVAFLHDIGDKPVAARLLDVNLLIYRTSEGITVAKDRCKHRGTRLSLGWMQDDLVVCPMHGLHYDAQGVCRKIPSIADPDARIPEKLRLQTYRAEQRYGIIWVCLKEKPAWPLPYWRQLEDSQYQSMFVPPGKWRVAAGRHVENFNDVAHFPWVHGATFGGKWKQPIRYTRWTSPWWKHNHRKICRWICGRRSIFPLIVCHWNTEKPWPVNLTWVHRLQVETHEKIR